MIYVIIPVEVYIAKSFELKCPNCGAKLKKEEGTIDIVCDYCKTEFKFDDEAHHIKYDDMEKTGYDFEKGRIKARDDALKEKITPDQKENVKKIGFGLLAFHLSGFFIGFAFIIIFVILAFTISRKAINSMHTDEYNSPLIHYKGVKELASTRWLLEKVNDKLVDDKHKLIVLYNNEDYKTVEEVS